MTNLRICKLLLALTLVGLSVTTQARTAQQMSFQRLSQQDGLSQNTINAILQDHVGYLWFATEGGLNRYDGVEFSVYSSDPGDPTALPDEYVWALAEDAGGDILLATRSAGLVRWSRKHNTFRQILSQQSPYWKQAQQTRSLMIDHAGQIWLGTRDAGILLLDSNGQALHWLGQDANGQSETGTVYAIQQSSNQDVYVASDTGLWLARGQSKRLIRQELAWPQADTAVSSLLQDADNRLWLGSFKHGLLRIGPDGSQQHFPAADDQLSHKDVRAIFQDADQRIWVATQGGLNLYQEASARFAHYVHQDNDSYSLADDRLMSLAQDSNGLLWIGSRIGGLSYWNPQSWDLGAQSPKALSGAAVLAFADAADNELWVGGFGIPLQRFNAGGELQASFTPDAGYPDRGNSPVTALLNDSNGDLWIGSFDDGLQRYRASNGQLKQLRHDPQSSQSLGSNGIMSLLQASDGSIWTGSFGGGLARIRPEDLSVQRIAEDTLGKLRITALEQDRHQQIWIASENHGLFRYDEAGGLTSIQSLGPQSPIYVLLNGPGGRLWVGRANSGLQYVNSSHLRSAQPRLKHADLAHPLPSQTVNGLIADADGRIWLSSNRGLVRLNPDSGELREYHRAQGLHSEEFNFGAYFRTSSGELVFGGMGGYNRFDPRKLRKSGTASQIIITGFEKFNRQFGPARPFHSLQQLSLEHNDSVVSLTYAMLDYSAPGKNRYSVMLDGFDRDWSPMSTRTRSTYTNLDPGNYVFRVRGLNSTGVASPSRNIAIHVRTAPWATVWAKTAYVLSAILVLLLLYRWRIKVIQREAHIERLAYFDQVTGLPNRELFMQRSAEMLAQRDDGLSLCMLVIKIGPLKHLHDSLGYHPSTDIWRSLAARLTQTLFGQGESTASYQLARLGEESFAVCMKLSKPESEALRWGRRLQILIGEPLEFGGHKVQVPAQVGIACTPRDGSDTIELMDHAETAARDQVSSALSPVNFYEPGMTERARERLSLESDLRSAIHEGQLQLYLQGKFSTDGALLGAEALCRWTHPSRGPIPPGVFVPLAEESELIMDLDGWMLDQACATMDHWQSCGYPAISIAVNVSAETFVSGRIFRALDRNRARHKIPAHRLEIEVTESVLASDMKLITESLKRIKRLGHLLSLDDFGTGYSSLTYLQQFPIDKLKIDQAFVRDLEHEAEQVSLCKAVVALARSLNLKTIAEGVENADQQRILTKLGCDCLQGFHLHRPQAAQEFENQFLASVPKNS